MNAAAMVAVSERAFFAAMGPLDVHPTPVGDYPYVSHWKLRYGGELVGISGSGSYKLAPRLAPEAA